MKLCQNLNLLESTARATDTKNVGSDCLPVKPAPRRHKDPRTQSDQKQQKKTEQKPKNKTNTKAQTKTESSRNKHRNT